MMTMEERLTTKKEENSLLTMESDTISRQMLRMIASPINSSLYLSERIAILGCYVERLSISDVGKRYVGSKISVMKTSFNEKFAEEQTNSENGDKNLG